MKKEKENIINIFLIIDKSVSAESWHFKRERWLFIKLKVKIIMIYLTVFNAIINVIEKKEDSENKS